MDETFMTRSHSSFNKPRKAVSVIAKSGTALTRSSLGGRKYHFITRDPNRFGNFSPSWTIPSSRQDPRPPVPTPGPGSYDIHKSQFHDVPAFTIKDRPSTNYRTVTSSIDFYLKREFPQLRNNTIGIKVPVQYGDPNIHAEPVSPYVENDQWKSYKISEKYTGPIPDPVPSPWRYNPNDPGKEQPISYSMPRAHERNVNYVPKDIADLPGPGSYNLVKPMTTYTDWANRLVPKPTRYQPPEKKLADKPWVVKKAETGSKNYIEFEMINISVPEEKKKEDVSK